MSCTHLYYNVRRVFYLFIYYYFVMTAPLIVYSLTSDHKNVVSSFLVQVSICAKFENFSL